MQDYCDSPSFKEHPLYKDEPNALQIQLYYDDVEVVNPLGGNTKSTNLVSNNTRMHVQHCSHMIIVCQLAVCKYNIACEKVYVHVLQTRSPVFHTLVSSFPNRFILLHPRQFATQV